MSHYNSQYQHPYYQPNPGFPPQQSYATNTWHPDGDWQDYQHDPRVQYPHDNGMHYGRTPSGMSNYRDFNRPGSSAEAFEYDSGPRRPDYGEVMGGAPLDQISEDNKHIQKYFSIFKKTPKYEYDERQRHAVVASLEMPLPPTGTAIAIGSLRIEAHGKNKKEARAALIRKLKTKVDSEGLMDVAVRYSASFKKGKRNGPESMDFGGDSRKFGGRAFNNNMRNVRPSGNQMAVDNAQQDAVPDSWDSVPIPPPPRENRSRRGGRDARSGPPQRFSNQPTGPVPTAWDEPNQMETEIDWWDERPVNEGRNAMQPGYSNMRSDEFHGGQAQSYHSQPYDSRFQRNQQYGGQVQHPREPKRPYAPPTSTRLPHNIDDAVRKYVQFYCNKFQLEVPSPHTFQHNHFQQSNHHQHYSRGGYSRRPKQVPGDWHTRLSVAAHTTADGKPAEAIEGLGVAKNKKDSIPIAWEDLCSRLLVISPQNLVDQFVSFATPFKRRVADMLNSPIRVDISDSAVDKVETLLSELKSRNAFHIPEDSQKSKPAILGTTPTAVTSRPNWNVHPDDLNPPPELSRSRDLPMYSYYASVMAAIESNPVTVLSAETGAGKTTQLPQFILAHAEKARLRDPRRPPVKVIVTQPRRIAAISVAQRVAQERGEVLGRDSSIGYQVRFEEVRPKADPEKGHVVFCTSGILLRRMQDDPTLGGVTHIILDEVHERDLNTDLLLIITRQLLQSRPDLKLILMSATAETGLFAEYFKGFGGDRTTNFFPPVVNVPGRLFPVTEFFLEDLVDIAERRMRARLLPDTQKFLRNELGGPVASSPFRSDDLPFDLFEAIIAYITTSMPPGAILVFLPGWLEINTLQSRLKDEDNFRVGFANPGIAKVYPLHSSVPTAGQQEVFDRPPEGVRKIILSTNIAETSVTINDIVYVIDSGKIRINSYDSDSRISSLSSVWASQSNIKQRSGRAGRCQPGQYYSLLSRRRRQGLPYSMPPELLRVDLQSTALKIKALNIGNTVGSVLSQAPQPPSRFNVDRAVEELTALGALHEDETLTPLGNVLSDMPVDPWIGKMVLQGAVYGCLDPILTVSGAMEIGRGIYSIHPDDKQRARRHILLNFAKGTESDQLTMLVAYRQWKAAGSSRDFSSNNFLHGTSLLNIDRAKNQLLRVLEDGGFLQRRRVAASYSKGDWSSDELMGGPDANKFAQDMGLVRAILCGSLFPNIAEVMGKDEYRSLNDPKLRLTGGSVNSWRGLVICSGVEEPNPPVPEHPAVVGKPVHQKGRQTPVDGRGRQTPIDTSDVLDSVSDDESGQQTDFVGAPLPTRLLSYQDKQRVDGLVYLRSTTRADPLALLLLSPGQMARNGAASLNWTRLDGRPAAILGGWLRIQVGDEQRARIIEDVRNWLAKYLDWIVWNRALRKERRGGGVEVKSDEEIGKELISVVAGLIGSENKE